MNRPELFVKSVDILVHAFKNGKLENMSSCNCAVGNLIAYRKGKYVFSDNWVNVLDEIRTNKQNHNYFFPLGKIAKRNANNLMAITEYTVEEVEKIERAFENIIPGYLDYGTRTETDPKCGLLRSIKVLGEIHDIPTETVSCMQEHVENDTYKFSYKFTKSEVKIKNECPIVNEL